MSLSVGPKIIPISCNARNAPLPMGNKINTISDKLS